MNGKHVGGTWGKFSLLQGRKKSFDDMVVCVRLSGTDLLLAVCKRNGKSLNFSLTRVLF